LNIRRLALWPAETVKKMGQIDEEPSAELALYRSDQGGIINGLSKLGNDRALARPQFGAGCSHHPPAPMIRRAIVRRLTPLAVSGGLLALVLWRVKPTELVEAAKSLDWLPLALATGGMVVALYLWDAVCLPVVYGVGGRRIGYGQALHLRGLSYLGGALNYELGQAVLAWSMARLQQVGLASMLARSILLAYHDILVLLSAGLIGTLLSDDPRAVRLRPVIAVSLLVVAAVGVALWTLPLRWREKYRWLDKDWLLQNWSIARSARLIPLRIVYFSILVVYAAVALSICGFPVDAHVVLGTIPLVLLADGLPSFAGLGTRETALQLVLAPDKPDAVLLAMSLFWSSGMIVGRFLLAVIHLWAHPRWGDPALPKSGFAEK
jgi:hypothetical protein